MRRHGSASSCASEGLDNAVKACYNEASNLLCTTPKQEARQPEGSKPSGLLFFARNASKGAAQECRCDWSTSRLFAFQILPRWARSASKSAAPEYWCR